MVVCQCLVTNPRRRLSTCRTCLILSPVEGLIEKRISYLYLSYNIPPSRPPGWPPFSFELLWLPSSLFSLSSFSPSPHPWLSPYMIFYYYLRYHYFISNLLMILLLFTLFSYLGHLPWVTLYMVVKDMSYLRHHFEYRQLTLRDLLHFSLVSKFLFLLIIFCVFPSPDCGCSSVLLLLFPWLHFYLIT